MIRHFSDEIRVAVAAYITTHGSGHKDLTHIIIQLRAAIELGNQGTAPPPTDGIMLVNRATFEVGYAIGISTLFNPTVDVGVTHFQTLAVPATLLVTATNMATQFMRWKTHPMIHEPP